MNILGEVVKFIKNTSFQNNETPPMGYEDVSFTYMYSLLSRAPSLVKEMNEESPFWKLFNETDQHDIAAHDALKLAKEKNLLQGYGVAFLNNNTDEEFVLPTGGVVQYKEYLICPVSTQRAIVFDNRRSVKLHEGEISLFEIESEEIMEINVQAFIQEQLRDKKYVVATNRVLLEQILQMSKGEESL